jgi:hypothetical protein
MDVDLAIEFLPNILYHPNYLVLLFCFKIVSVLVIIRLQLLAAKARRLQLLAAKARIRFSII